MIDLSEADKLEIWIVLNLLEHAHADDRVKLQVKAGDLAYRLREQGKIGKARGVPQP